MGFSLLSGSNISWIISLNNDPNDWSSSAILEVVMSIIHFTMRDPMSDSPVELCDSSSFAAYRSREETVKTTASPNNTENLTTFYDQIGEAFGLKRRKREIIKW